MNYQTIVSLKDEEKVKAKNKEGKVYNQKPTLHLLVHHGLLYS